MGSKQKNVQDISKVIPHRRGRFIKDNKIQTKCILCGQLYHGKDHLALTRHIYARHALAEDHACDTCGNRYTDKKGLVRHILYIHLEYRPYKCRFCDRKFSRRDLFRIHLRKLHPERDLEKETRIGCKQSWSLDWPTPSTPAGSTNSPPLQEQKGASTRTKSSPVTKPVDNVVPMNNANEDFVSKCVICNLSLVPPSRNTLSKHLNAEHTNSNTCEKCDNKYADKKGLLRHYLHVHFHFRPYSCTMCERSFARKDHLRSHAHMHHLGGERQGDSDGQQKMYECDRCDKWFVKEESLAKHILVCTPNEGKVNVERILEKREVNGRVEYLIKWVGYNENESTWETEDSITGRREDNEGDTSDIDEESSPDDDAGMEDMNDSADDSDKDAYLDELYPSPHLCHIDIGVI